MLLSILPTNVFAVSMTTSLQTALVAAALAQAEPDTPFAEEPEELRDVIPFTVAAPTLGQTIWENYEDFKPIRELTEDDIYAYEYYNKNNTKKFEPFVAPAYRGTK